MSFAIVLLSTDERSVAAAPLDCQEEEACKAVERLCRGRHGWTPNARVTPPPGAVRRGLEFCSVGKLRAACDGMCCKPSRAKIVRFTRHAGWPEGGLPEALQMKYTVLVNGERRTVDVPERMPLLWVLRDVWT